MDDQHRTIRQFKQEIHSLFGFRATTLNDKSAFISYCKTYIFPLAPKPDEAIEQALEYFKNQKLEPYSDKQLNRFFSEVNHQFEANLFAKITQSLSDDTKKKLDQLLIIDDLADDGSANDNLADNGEKDVEEAEETKTAEHKRGTAITCDLINLSHLKNFQVELKVYSILSEIQNYQHLQQLRLLTNLETPGCTRKLLIKYFERIMSEYPYNFLLYP
ncbi:MAG: hypothetical protein WCP46_01640 [Alphaproteobacteria bacterium]